ncbi:methyl-accepting chemotaxis sensory transducer [Rippkaea orientalis PCC 8801]|uniref:Methyl-accepting chemotaxis sensory transducer n=1 Tax=Rippkaea orientalis (strain PCC 8801 / RF-1) TaxID=41431 RepID=B7JXP7_RIPO1|nr:HAMP domain-containing methyl-accepting chemotaxis protein [Rippkaea orientalis]ACK64804.1 methyl-accepting chemotaxis sensory transducer [Rippkaea orientalis PCC 8801]
MAPGTDYSKLYNQAYVAYGQGEYEEAATLIEPMAEAYSQDPHVLLLRGHIHLSLQQYETACADYQSVLTLTDQQDLLKLAQQGLAQAQEMLGQASPNNLNHSQKSASYLGSSSLNDEDEDEEDGLIWQDNEEGEADWDSNFQIDENLDWDFDEEDFGEPTIGHDPSQANPFDNAGQTTFRPPQADVASLAVEDDLNLETPDTWQSPFTEAMEDFPFTDDEDLRTEPHPTASVGKNTFLVTPKLDNSRENPEGTPIESFLRPSSRNLLNYNSDEDLTLPPSSSSMGNQENQLVENLDSDLSHLTEMAAELPDSDIFTRSAEVFSDNLSLDASDLMSAAPTPTTVTWVKPNEAMGGDLSVASNQGIKPTVEVAQQGWAAWFINASLKHKPWIAAGATGIASFLMVLLVSTFTSVMSPKPQSGTTPVPQTSQSTPKPQNNQKPAAKATNKPSAAKSGSPVLLMALLGGLTGFSTTLLFSFLICGQVKRTIEDLQAQFDAMYAGDFNVKATIHSSDELGQLSLSFNQLARIILTTTSEAQQRAAETEQAQEDLTRQVIRLLDDVEGAARGDLTVEAVVTADVLGAVADAFNLTIQNLREIVGQVKQAAKQVNKGSTDSESFARNNSSDALRMAEELAVTLNSVQVMTESIQRVAENAREAEEVASVSSVTALKGGEAVERTVAGILGIRETVSDTTRKVKRLAEASQEISKIVALISQIASRTNLLALNASIQAARAGEAGRGFAIVADEVRQLADRSAKSLKEIEQIVLQIQSETGSVMTAMEEGIQQVINLVDTSEQAKRSLEDIIDVSNRINGLVRSITADTVKQRENSRAVTQVMQSVELTAQEASQESQRVAGSLQTLVAISRDLLASVERFRVDKSET